MATKYILDPSGNIIKVMEDGSVEKSTPNRDGVSTVIKRSPEEKDTDGLSYLDVVNQSQNAFVTKFFEDSIGEQLRLIPNQISTESQLQFFNEGLKKSVPVDPSFGFRSQGEKTVDSFSPFNSFTDKQEGSPDENNPKPKVFADEFEILTGFRLRTDEVSDNFSEISLYVANLFIEHIVEIVAIEAILLANNLLNYASGEENQKNTIERYRLRLGKYDFTEYDVFTKYVYNVLNYPHESSNSEDRISAYLLGFSSWLSPDLPIDIDNVIKENMINKSNTIQLLNKSIPIALVNSLIVSAIEISLAAATNTTAVNRIKLLKRKFDQEKYWDENQLYSAKERDAFDFGTQLNYYKVKFIIERMQVGLKLLNKYHYDKSYLQEDIIESPLTRVSAAKKIISFGKTLELSLDRVLKKKSKSTSLFSIQNESYKWDYRETVNNRLSAKRKNESQRPQTTRIRALPQGLNLNTNFLKSLALNNSNANLDLTKDLLQNFYTSKDRRLPSDLVHQIEQHLESEYVPFYFHDLRTNEILSFHAFIESISDSFSPEYNSVSGFGRIDDVKSYVKTTRNINLTFIIAATSQLDHDLMWYQINKIVAMVYPQWSEAYAVNKFGDKGEKEKSKFKYPFTQVPTASPLIRLRVGDVIKSNYSRTNLSRLFGVEETEFLEEKKGKLYDAIEEERVDKLSLGSEGYKYKILPGLYKTEPSGIDGIDLLQTNALSEVINIDNEIEALNTKEIEKQIDSNSSSIKVLVQIHTSKLFNLIVDLKSIIKIDNNISSAKFYSDIVKNDVDLNFLTKLNKEVLDPEIGDKSNNPITRSYESGMSRGLAGFITNLDVSYNESTWETSRIGSKAPMLVKINIGFSPIHDIPPGLDHNGMLRAPTYNVGRINNTFFGDPLDNVGIYKEKNKLSSALEKDKKAHRIRNKVTYKK